MFRSTICIKNPYNLYFNITVYVANAIKLLWSCAQKLFENINYAECFGMINVLQELVWLVSWNVWL